MRKSTPTDARIREAVRVELARRDWNRGKLADESGFSRQYVSKLLNGHSGKFSHGWQKVLDTLGLEVVIQKKEA